MNSGKNQPQVSTSKPIPKNQFKIALLKDVIGFIDLKGLLNLSLVNKEFNFFIKSVFTLKKISENKIITYNYLKKHNLIPDKDKKPKEREKKESSLIKDSTYGLFSGFANLMGNL